MRDDRIQYTRHPNLRQHVISRFKNRTNHALPNPDISLATDRFARTTGAPDNHGIGSQITPAAPSPSPKRSRPSWSPHTEGGSTSSVPGYAGHVSGGPDVYINSQRH